MSNQVPGSVGESQPLTLPGNYRSVHTGSSHSVYIMVWLHIIHMWKEDFFFFFSFRVRGKWSLDNVLDHQRPGVHAGSPLPCHLPLAGVNKVSTIETPINKVIKTLHRSIQGPFGIWGSIGDFRVHSGSIQGPYRFHWGSIGDFRVRSGSILCSIRGPFRIPGSIQGPFRVHSESIRDFRVHLGSIQGPFRFHSGFQVSFRFHSGSILSPFRISGSVQIPLGIHWGFIGDPFRIHSGSFTISGSVQVSFGIHSGSFRIHSGSIQDLRVHAASPLPYHLPIGWYENRFQTFSTYPYIYINIFIK